MAENKFPTEVVDLPSKGYFYPEDNPLSSGQVEMRYMTAKDEDILTSQKLIQKGTVLDILLRELLIDKKINLDDILIGDKNALLVAARVLAYGKEYEFEYTTDSGQTKKHKLDLTTLTDVGIKLEDFEKGQNLFDYTLPNSERKVQFKFLTSGEVKKIDKEIEALNKLSDIDKGLSTRLKHIIVSIEDNTDKNYIKSFVDNELYAIDSLALREYIASITPDIDTEITISDEGEEVTLTVPMTVQFFWPTIKL
jgi:hypothetical protein